MSWPLSALDDTCYLRVRDFTFTSLSQYFSVNSGELEHNIAQLRKKLDRESQRIRDTLWGYVVCNCREFSAIPSVAHEQHYRVGQVVAIGDRAQIRHCTKVGRRGRREATVERLRDLLEVQTLIPSRPQVKDRVGTDAIVLKSFDKSNLTLQVASSAKIPWPLTWTRVTI